MMPFAPALLLLAVQTPTPAPDMVELVRRYTTDERALERFYDIELSESRWERLDAFARQWLQTLEELDYDALDREGRIDFHLLRNASLAGVRDRQRERERRDEVRAFLPILEDVFALEEARWRFEPVVPREAADRIEAWAEAADAVLETLKQEKDGEEGTPAPAPDPVAALRFARWTDAAGAALDTWFRHYDAYVPGFEWWVGEPYERLDDGLDELARELREKVAGLKGEDEDPLVGDPIGREALVDGLRRELIAYAPEELVEIAEESLAWCDAEMIRAARELGFGDDWKAALDHVKSLHVPPGEQDALVARQALEAIELLDARDLVTIEPLCRETWRVEMLSEREQRTLPFAAYGGQSVLVAYATEDMPHERKLMSMRGNNVHFSRIVTPHELIPGHHLQAYMSERYNSHRQTFRTPFYVEGWALYWELLLWDLGYQRGPEDAIGMLLWRKHRAARILVSLRYHLGEMGTDEMIAFLTERVGLEEEGARSEVRRYVGGGYGPLYQCAYMLGGLQLRGLHRELVASGRMSPKAFHDAVLRSGPIPIELVRARLSDLSLPRDWEPTWRFAD